MKRIQKDITVSVSVNLGGDSQGQTLVVEKGMTARQARLRMAEIILFLNRCVQQEIEGRAS